MDPPLVLILIFNYIFLNEGTLFIFKQNVCLKVNKGMYKHTIMCIIIYCLLFVKVGYQIPNLRTI
jgi:hypothetical protein